MILRCGLRCGGKRVDKWAALVAIFLGANLDPSSASAEDRAVLGAVTPHSIALGEEVTVRWSYEDGDGGTQDSWFCFFAYEQVPCVQNVQMVRYAVLFYAALCCGLRRFYKTDVWGYFQV